MNNFLGYLKKQSPLILAILGAGGTIATGIFAAEATPKAMRRVRQAEIEKGDKLTKLEIVKAAAPAYIPTAGIAVTTITCIFASTALSRRQQASLASAYAVLDRIHKEYKEKVIELYGEDADKEIRREIVRNHIPDDQLPPWDENQIFYEEHYGKFFERTREQVLEAEYHFNRNFALRGYATLNEFYEFLGLPKTSEGEALGWSLYAGEAFYGYSWVDFEHHSYTMEDGLVCCEIRMPFAPTADYLSDFE